MKAFWAFMKKELLESVRTWRLVILLVVFVALGIMNPLVARLTPLLIETFMPEGMPLFSAEPTAWDSWAQFFKNVGQMGLIAIVIVYCGTMASELSRATLVNILTKGMPRATVILAKFTTATAIWTLCYVVSVGITALYNLYFWETVEMSHSVLAFAGIWLFGLLLLALLHLGGVLFKGLSGGLLMTGGVVLVLMLLGIAPKTAPYNPMTLTSGNLALLSGLSPVEDFAPAFAICAALTVLLMTFAVFAFNKKQL